MSLKRYSSSAWQDISNLKRYSSSAWRDCNGAYVYKSDAWEKAWPSEKYLVKNSIDVSDDGLGTLQWHSWSYSEENFDYCYGTAYNINNFAWELWTEDVPEDVSSIEMNGAGYWFTLCTTDTSRFNASGYTKIKILYSVVETWNDDDEGIYDNDEFYLAFQLLYNGTKNFKQASLGIGKNLTHSIDLSTIDTNYLESVAFTFKAIIAGSDYDFTIHDIWLE